MTAPTTAIFGLPAASRRAANTRRIGLKRIADTAGRYNARRRRGLPSLLKWGRPRTELPGFAVAGSQPGVGGCLTGAGPVGQIGDLGQHVERGGRPDAGDALEQIALLLQAGVGAHVRAEALLELANLLVQVGQVLTQ